MGVGLEHPFEPHPLSADGLRHCFGRPRVQPAGVGVEAHDGIDQRGAALTVVHQVRKGGGGVVEEGLDVHENTFVESFIE